MNPAGITSRGATSSDLQTWLNGTAWMLHDIETEGVDNCAQTNEGVPEDCVVEMKSDSRKEYEIKWSFNTPKAPWQGRFFERLVKSVKRCLKKILGQSCVTYEELLTVLMEIECVLNSRPLTYVSTEDLQEPLMPSHLICGRRILSVPAEDVADLKDPDWNTTSEDLMRRAVYLQSLISKFWNRWSKEYLLELRESHRNAVRDSSTREIRVGELVMVHNKNQRRGLWKLGKVEKLNKLYPLEVRSEENTTNSDVEDTSRDNVAQQTTHEKDSTRPRRKTAIEADVQRKQWIANEYI